MGQLFDCINIKQISYKTSRLHDKEREEGILEFILRAMTAQTSLLAYGKLKTLPKESLLRSDRSKGEKRDSIHSGSRESMS